eukprot:SM000222S06958  [mRNA]  locus=s222:55760:58000:+ [translate_table: standard]
MSPFQQWAYTFSYTAPLGFVIGYYGFMYSYGGPVTIFFGFLATSMGTLCMAWAMSEVMSAYPTLGSVYYWVAQLVPKKHAPWISWFTGWVYLVGSFCGTALNEYLLAQFIAAMILLGTGGAQGGGYQLSTAQVFGVTAGVFVLHYFVSIVSTRWLGRLSSIGAAYQIISLFGVCITLLAVSPKYQKADFVFTHFVHAPGNGISSAVMVVLLGLPYFQSILTGFEVGSHVVEEVTTAAIAGPRAMVRSVYVTATVEIVLLLVLGFCIQVPDNVLGSNTATGGGDSSAAIQIFYDAFHARYGTGTAGAMVVAGLAAGSLFFGNITNVTLTARMAYAMARDVALPGHQWLVSLTAKERIPINATILTVIVHLFDNGFVPGPFKLGRKGLYIGIWGSFWGTLMSVLFCLPPSYPVTGSTFNYAPVSMAGCLGGGAIYWFTIAKYNYFGPKRTIDLVLQEECSPDNKPAAFV